MSFLPTPDRTGLTPPDFPEGEALAVPGGKGLGSPLGEAGAEDAPLRGEDPRESRAGDVLRWPHVATDRDLHEAVRQTAARSPGLGLQALVSKPSSRWLPLDDRVQAAALIRAWWLDPDAETVSWASWLRRGGLLWRHEWVAAVVTVGAQAPWTVEGEALASRLRLFWQGLSRTERIRAPGRALLLHPASPRDLWASAFGLRDPALTLDLLRMERRHHDVALQQWLRRSRQPLIQQALLADPSCPLDRGWGARRLARLDPERALGVLLWRWDDGTLEPLPRVPLAWLRIWMTKHPSPQTLALVQALRPLVGPVSGGSVADPSPAD